MTKRSDKFDKAVNGNRAAGILFGLAAGFIVHGAGHIISGMKEQPLDWFFMNVMDKFFTAEMPEGYQLGAMRLVIAAACITGSVVLQKQTQKIKNELNL